MDVQREIHEKLEEQLKQLTLLHALEGEELKRLEDVYVDAIKAPLIIEIELRTLQIDMAKLNRKRNVFQSATQEDLKTLEEHTAHAAALEAQMKKEAEVSERRRQERLDAELKLKNATHQLENTKKQVEESSKKLKSEKKELRRLKKELKKLNAHVDQINQRLHLQSACREIFAKTKWPLHSKNQTIFLGKLKGNERGQYLNFVFKKYTKRRGMLLLLVALLLFVVGESQNLKFGFVVETVDRGAGCAAGGAAASSRSGGTDARRATVMMRMRMVISGSRR